MVEIEKGVPIPPRNRGAGAGRPPAVGREVVEAMDKMGIGDSIKIPFVQKNTLYVFLSRVRKRTNKRYRFMPESGAYRIWRTE